MQTAADLIDCDRLCCKFYLTKNLYQPTVAGEMCKISLSRGKFKENLIWLHSELGLYIFKKVISYAKTRLWKIMMVLFFLLGRILFGPDMRA